MKNDCTLKNIKFCLSFLFFLYSCGQESVKTIKNTNFNNYEINIANSIVYNSIVRYLDSIPYKVNDGGLISVNIKTSAKKSNYRISWNKNGLLLHAKPSFYSTINDYPIVFFHSGENIIYNPKVKLEIVQRFIVADYAHLTYGCDEIIVTFCQDTSKYRVEYIKWPPQMPSSPPEEDTLCN